MKHVRMINVNYTMDWGRVKELDFERVAKLKRERYHANMEWVMGATYCEGRGDLVSFDTPHFEKMPILGDLDLVREYTPIAEKYGIDVISYVNLHWYPYEFAEKNPGWEQVLKDGTPYGRANPLYGNGTTMCINSPWRDWALKLLGEVMKTGVKGVFLDGPVVFPEACYCKHCRSLLKAQTGDELPVWGDWDNPVWTAFLRFRSDSMTRFLKDAQAVVKRADERAIVFLNAGARPSWETPTDIVPLAPYQDFSGAEAYFDLGRAAEPYSQLRVGKYLRASSRPSVVFVQHAQGVWHYLPLEGDEMRLALAQTLASGSNTWIALCNGELLEEERGWRPVHDVLEVTDRHPEAFEDTEPVADVGILASSDTARMYRSDEESLYRRVEMDLEENLIAKGGVGERLLGLKEQKRLCDDMVFQETSGFFDALTHQRIPFKMVLEARLDEELDDLDVLVIPNQACLSADRKRAIEEFVRGGGKLVASFESGRYDQDGKREEDGFFRDFLGVAAIQGTFPLAVREEYIRFKQDTLGFRQEELMPRPTHVLQTRPSGGIEVPALLLEPTGQHYAPLKGESPFPALWRKSYGKGEVVYLPALYGAFYHTYRESTIERFLGEVVRSLLAKQPPVWIEGPASVTYELFRKGATWYVHLLNAAGDMKRPVSLVDVHGVRVHFREPVRCVRALVSETALPVHAEPEGARVELCRLGVYEVIEARGE